MKYRKAISKAVLALGLFFAIPAKAICPVCTVAVGAGIGLSRWLGIDDSITGLWIGARNNLSRYVDDRMAEKEEYKI